MRRRIPVNTFVRRNNTDNAIPLKITVARQEIVQGVTTTVLQYSTACNKIQSVGLCCILHATVATKKETLNNGAYAY